MPNSPSAIKRIRSDAKKKERNQTVLSTLRTLDKRLRQCSGNPAKAKTLAQQAISNYDRAVSKGVIPRGHADRKKSKIAAFLASLKKK